MRAGPSAWSGGWGSQLPPCCLWGWLCGCVRWRATVSPTAAQNLGWTEATAPSCGLHPSAPSSSLCVPSAHRTAIAPSSPHYPSARPRLPAPLPAMGDLPGLVRLSIALRIQPNDGPVFFKVDGQRFGQNRTIKLLTGSSYKVEVKIKPTTLQVE